MGFKLAERAMCLTSVTVKAGEKVAVSGWTKAILVVVALRADDKTGKCFPSQKTLADSSGASVATVNRSLDQLEALGIITRSRRTSAQGYRTSDQITVHAAQLSPSQVGTEPTRQTANLADSKGLDITLQTPNYHGDSAEGHSVDHSVGHSDPRSIDDDFTEFYEAYPRKQGRTDALKAYRSARKSAAAENILAGARAYNLATAGKEREFIKLPAGWLRGQRWEDTPIVGPQGAQTTVGRYEAADECPRHPGYPSTPLAPCGRCEREREALAVPEGANF